MGSKSLTSKSGNGHRNLNTSLNLNSIGEVTLEDLKTYNIRGIQFGTNPLVNSIVLGENDDPKDNYTAPPVIGFHNGIGGVIVDVLGIGKNNCVHCFGFLEAEELDMNNEGIVIEFGEYEYGEPNDFGVKTYYTSKLGGLRLYVVKNNWFESYCSLTRVKCKINKNEILEDILTGISKNYKWRLQYYEQKKQNCQDFLAVLLKYLEVQSYEFCKGSMNMIPDKIKKVLEK